MTDEEINRRVAEIEGWTLEEWACEAVWVFSPSEMLPAPPPYATDWAWCGPFFEKCIEKHGTSFMERVDVFMYDEDRPLKAAICLAGIAAHEGK